MLVTTLNLISRSMGTDSAVFITTIKLFALLFVGILGMISLIRHGAGPGLQPSTLFEGSSLNPSNYAIALYSGLWAFDGWDACSVSWISALGTKECVADST
jgi:amino acid transporter